jgi:hypothetical protein
LTSLLFILQSRALPKPPVSDFETPLKNEKKTKAKSQELSNAYILGQI